MSLPFSHDAFLDVFGAYNTALWPAVAAMWVVTVGVALRLVRRRRMEGAGVFALLAVHWAWSGVAYHWVFFRQINPAATLFAALFLLQAALFAWLAIGSRAQFTIGRRPRGLVGGAFLAYGLAYPFIGLALGLDYPRVPLFAVPCPTALVTVGLLLISSGVPRGVSIVPMLWAFVGGSAAVLLDIRADLPLVAAGVLLGLDIVAPGALFTRT